MSARAVSQRTSVADSPPLEPLVTLGCDHPVGLVTVARGQEVVHGLVQMAVGEQPTRRAGMETAHPIRDVAADAVAQQFREEVVVPVPLAGAIERDEEQRSTLDLVEAVAGGTLAGHGIAQLRGEPLEDRCLEEEPGDLGVLLVDDLLDEVLRDHPVAAGQRRDGAIDVVGVLQRDARQLQPGGPAVGTVDQRRDLLVGQGAPGDTGQHLAAVVLAEREIGPAQLHETTLHAWSGQRPRWIPAARRDDPHARRRSFCQDTEVLDDRRVGDAVEILEHQDEAAFDLVERCDQRLDELGSESHATDRKELAQASGCHLRVLLQRSEQVAEERRCVVVAGIELHPHDGARSPVDDPLADEEGLAGTRWRGDDCEATWRQPVEPPLERRSSHGRGRHGGLHRF